MCKFNFREPLFLSSSLEQSTAKFERVRVQSIWRRIWCSRQLSGARELVVWSFHRGTLWGSRRRSCSFQHTIPIWCTKYWSEPVWSRQHSQPLWILRPQPICTSTRRLQPSSNTYSLWRAIFNSSTGTYLSGIVSLKKGCFFMNTHFRDAVVDSSWNPLQHRS